MSRRFDHQAADGIISRCPVRGITIAVPEVVGTCSLTTGVPTNGTAGFAPGCLWLNFLASAEPYIYVNEGTNTSSLWSGVQTAAGTGGDDTFATLTVTTLFRGGTGGLTINAKNDGTAGSASLGLTGDSVYLGSSTPHGGNASAALGFGTPGNTTVGFANGAGSAVSIGFNSTGNLGSSSFTFDALVNFLKAKGILPV